jgi:hypothetical protein
MAGDRFIYFEDRVPTHEEIRTILENYLGGCGTVTEPQPNWWMIDLPGRNTSTFKGIQGSGPDVFTDPDFDVRWIEVIFQRTAGLPPSLDVLTRHADSFTGDVASSLARTFAAFFRGRLEDT